MTTKDYLLKIRRLRDRIAVMERHLDTCHDEAAKPTSSLTALSMGGTERCSRVDTYICGSIDLERENIEPLRRELQRLKQETLDVINRMPEGRWSEILVARYILGHTWPSIAEAARCSVRYAQRLHGMALQSFTKYAKEYGIGSRDGDAGG